MKLKRVLCVDDATMTRKILKKMIGQLDVEELYEAENGRAALALLEELKDKSIDLIITDWNMPQMNGEVMVKKLRQMEQYKTTPILMITTRGRREDVITALKAGVNGFIKKPFTFTFLSEKIKQLIPN